MLDCVVREAKLGDGKGISKIASDDLGYDCKAEDVEASLPCFLSSGDDKIFVACLGDEIVGFAHGNMYRTLYMAPLVNLMGIAVSKKVRGMGLGKALLSNIEEWCHEKQAAGVRVNSSSKRTEAHKFYRNLGYTIEKDQKRFLKYV